MSVRARYELVTETIQEMRAAAEDRYTEGIALLVEGQHSGGVYVLGYAAEMFLKTSYFLFQGNNLLTQVSGLLAPAWTLGTSWFPGRFVRRDYHDLVFWADMLTEARLRVGAPLPTPYDTEYITHTTRVALTWWVEMRYRRSIASDIEATEMLDSVSWLRANSIRLATP